jgi:hypothetical protein
MRLRSIPPASRVQSRSGLRSADPIRCRTSKRRAAGENPGQHKVNTIDYHKDSTTTAWARQALHCTTCGGTRLAGVRMANTDFEVDCLDCGDWQEAR